MAVPASSSRRTERARARASAVAGEVTLSHRHDGVTIRLIGKATEAMLSAGALEHAANRIAISAEEVMA